MPAKVVILTIMCVATALSSTRKTQSIRSSNSGSTGTAGAGQNEAKTIRGCLSGSVGNYTLMEDRSGTIYSLVGADHLMDGQTGHELEVSGLPTAGGTSAAGGAGVTEAAKVDSSNNSPRVNTYKVDSVKMISDHCGTGSADEPSGKVPVPANPNPAEHF